MKVNPAAESIQEESGEGGFRRELNLRSATMIVIGSMIGSGIFIVSADIARTLGSPGYMLLVWVITGLMTLICALSYGELAGMMPQAGGQYIYLREAYNSLTGFLYGWTLFLVIQTGTIAAVAVAFAKYTGILIPAFSENNILLDLGWLKISAAQILAIASIALLTWTNSRGVKTGKFIQNIFTTTKVLALFGLIFLGIFVAKNSDAIAQNWSIFWDAKRTIVESGAITSISTLSGGFLWAMVGTAMVGALFSSDAWNNVTFTGAEIINPKRNIPMSLFLGTLTVTIIYILANIAYLMVLPLRGDPQAADVFGRGIQFALNDRVGAAAAFQMFGQIGIVIMAVCIMISTFGCNNGLILAGSRVYYAMAQNKLFFRKAGELNKHSVPANALMWQAVWASVLCLSGKYGDLLDYVVFAVLIFYILTIAGIFVLRSKRPDAERPYKAFGYPVLPVIYIILAAAICLDLLVYKPLYSYPGLAIVLSGIPVYFLWKRKNSV